MTTKRRVEKIVMILSVVCVLGLFTYFLWDILVPVLQMNFKNDTEGAKELLAEKDYPYITVLGRKGGTPVAVAAVNALLRLAGAER